MQITLLSIVLYSLWKRKKSMRISVWSGHTVWLIVFFLSGWGFCQGEFYREYWANFDSSISNHKDGRWRVNDGELSLHERFGIRSEARANGLMLIDVPENLFQLEQAELYLELWGGHGKTANKRFFVNGRGPYALPRAGVEEGHETYSYPVTPLQVSHLVNGINAIQFATDRGNSFWGHYIIDNAAIRAVLAADHPDIQAAGLTGFMAKPVIENGKSVFADNISLYLDVPKMFSGKIESVNYYARYIGFDDDGDGQDDGWHGFTLEKKPVNHVGSSETFPYEVIWDTRELPDQSKPMAVRAVITLSNGLHYRTPLLEGIELARTRRVVMIKCTELPIPFHSRASRESIGKFYLPQDLSGLQRATLWIKTWDGGEGTIKDPFTINNYPYHVISGKHIHDVVFTVSELNLDHLLPGENIIRLFSDTMHHGIEILLPGPVLMLHYRE